MNWRYGMERYASNITFMDMLQARVASIYDFSFAILDDHKRDYANLYPLYQVHTYANNTCTMEINKLNA